MRAWDRYGMRDLEYITAHKDYYLPMHRAADLGIRYLPAAIPPGWTRASETVWTIWIPPGEKVAAQGWKVHVSARLERAQAVLDTVAGICCAERIPFKHLSSSQFFMTLHHKHASRIQAGKFCAAYPPDVPAARRLMERLAEALHDEDGPYILTDRRFGESRTVHYRYGAFADRRALRPDGTRMPLIEDGHGRLVEDRRIPAFVLPEGIGDPFCAREVPAADVADHITLKGYVIDKPIRHSNAGGSYQGKVQATGRPVFLKEARAHHGLFWDGSTAPARLRQERDTLLAIHRAAPGLCPAPLDYFSEWEHEFLVTEFIAGTSLPAWLATHNPFIQAAAGPDTYHHYYRQCLRILDELATAFERLHQAGYVFVDVSPGNVLLDESGHPRLVDFEAASRLEGPLHRMATPWFSPPARQPIRDPAVLDAYGLSALALQMLVPLHEPAERCPAVLRHLRYELDECAPVPERLWQLVTRFYSGPGSFFPEESAGTVLPTPDQVAEEPRACLGMLRDAVAAGLSAMADHDDPDALYPTVPLGYMTNTLCLAYGTAGVIHALHTVGQEVPHAVVARFRRDSVSHQTRLPPGLHVGQAGVAWVLAELGFTEEAAALLGQAAASPLLQQRATLGEGTAGVGMAYLALYHRTGDAAHLQRAADLADSIPRGPDLVTCLGPDDSIGLLHGRAGIALYLYYLARAAGVDDYLVRGRRLLHEELARAIPLPDGALSFPDSAVRRRSMPYLFTGSAGILFAAARYAACADDPRLRLVLPRIMRDVYKNHAVQAGLYCGLSGLGLALSEYAELTGCGQAADEALRIGRALFKYAVPGPAGVRFPGHRMVRFSADLWSGSAGILLFLDRLLTGCRDLFFTFDAVAAPTLARGTR